jgi:hypothetical protein
VTELPVKAGSGVVLYEVWNVSGRDPQDFMVNEPTEKATHVLRLSYCADVTVNRYGFFECSTCEFNSYPLHNAEHHTVHVR